VATIFTEAFGGTPGTEVAGFTLIRGSLLLHTGGGYATGQDGTDTLIRYDSWSGVRAVVAKTQLKFAAPATGDWQFGLCLFLDDDNFYELRIRTDNNSPPKLSILKVVAGVESTVMAETNGPVLSAGTFVTFELRRNGSTLQAFVDDTQYGGDQTDATLTANWRTGYRWIYYSSNAWHVDDLTMEDFTTEPSPSGRVLQVGTSSYDEDGMRAASIALGRLEISYISPRRLTFREYVSHTEASFRPELEVRLLQGSPRQTDFRGVLKVVRHLADAAGGEYVEYEAWGPRQQAKYVTPSHPDTGALSITWNADPEDDDYDADYADKTIGEILTWYFDTFNEDLRKHRAAPNGDVYVAAELALLDVKPTKFTIRGDFEALVQTLIGFQTVYACLIDHDTGIWHFVDWTASPAKDLSFTSLVTPANQVDDDSSMAYTAVLLRSIRREKVDFRASTEDGGMEPAWSKELEKYYTPFRSQRSSIGCTVNQVIGARIVELAISYERDEVYTNEWQGTTCRFIGGDAAGGEGDTGKLFTIGSNTASSGGLFRVTLTADLTTAPSPGDAVDLTDSDEYVTTDEPNGFKKVHKWYRVADELKRDLFKKSCTTAFLVRLENSNSSIKQRVPLQIEFAMSPGVIAVGLPIVTFGSDTKGAACETPGDYESADLELNAEHWKTTVLERRYPTAGYHGTAYSTDQSRWDGGGPPLPTDWGVMREMIIEDPHYTSEDQNDDVDALLESWLLPRCSKPFAGRHAYRASAGDGVDRDFVNLNTSVTFSSTRRTTGWESGAYIFAHSVTYDYGQELTVLELGSEATFENPEYERLRDGILREGKQSEMERLLETLRDEWECKRDAFVKAAREAIGPICGSQVRVQTTRKVSTSVTKIIRELEREIQILKANKDDEEEITPDPIPDPEPESESSDGGVPAVRDSQGAAWAVDSDGNWRGLTLSGGVVVTGSDGYPILGDPGTPARGPKSHKHYVATKTDWDGVDDTWPLEVTPRLDDPPICYWYDPGSGEAGIYLEGVHYTVAGSTVTFTAPPAASRRTHIHLEVENYRVHRQCRARVDFLRTVGASVSVLADWS